MAERPDFARIGDLVPAGSEGAAAARAAAGQAPDARGSELNQQLAAVWAEVVGVEVSGNARPVQLRDGRLVVTTSSSAWAQTLQLMSEMVRARLNERLGHAAIERVVFRHAGWEGSPARQSSTQVTETQVVVGPRARGGVGPSGRAPALIENGQTEFSGEEKQALDDLERLPLSPAVKATIRDAMKAGFVRARQDSGR